MTLSSEIAIFVTMKWSSPHATKQILLSGQSDMDEDKLMAWYPEYKTENDSVTSVDRVLAGQVNLVSYEKKKVTLYLVPVNGSTCPDAAYVQKTLNAIYAQAVVEFDVKRMDNLKVAIGDSYTTTIDNTDNDERMNYTPDEKTVIGALEDNANYTSDAYFLFFFDGAKDPSLKGYMPLKKQYGFIFKFKQYPDEYLRTVAHETGHGVFRLYHTFSDQNLYPQTQGGTANLMDYSDANALGLYKYQWDWVHDPSFRLYWFEKAEEAEMFRESWFSKKSDGTPRFFSDNDCLLAFYKLFKKAYQYPVFKKVYGQLLTAAKDSFYVNGFKGLKTTEIFRGNGTAGKAEDAGEFDPFQIYSFEITHNGEKKTINRNYPTIIIYGLPNLITEETVFEEFFHAGQYIYYKHDTLTSDYYRKNVKSFPNEVEVKIAKVLVGIDKTDKYQIMKNIPDKLKKGVIITNNDLETDGFKQFILNVGKEYTKDAVSIDDFKYLYSLIRVCP
jgi:hypothetical protein